MMTADHIINIIECIIKESSYANHYKITLINDFLTFVTDGSIDKEKRIS